MNVLAIVVSLAGVACHFFLASFYYGRLTQEVKGHTAKISKTETMVEQHHGEIGVLYGHAGISR